MSDKDKQSQKAGEGSTLIQAGGNVNLGLSYADAKQMIAEERERIAEQVWDRAEQMLKEAGIQSGPVATKALVPLLQYASIEEGGYLQEQWAALLANAATAKPGAEHMPCFVEILRQLSPREALFVSVIFDHAAKMGPQGLRTHHDSPYTRSLGWCGGIEARELFNLFEAQDGYNQAVDNILRLGLIACEQGEIDELGQGLPSGSTQQDLYFLTMLGSDFVTVCRRPKKAEPR